jgi:hypothetical protein
MKAPMYIGIFALILVVTAGPYIYQMMMSHVPLEAPTFLSAKDSEVILILGDRKCDNQYIIERSINQKDWVLVGAKRFDSYVQSNDSGLKLCEDSFIDTEVPPGNPTLYYRYRLLTGNGVILRSSTIGIVTIEQSTK